MKETMERIRLSNFINNVFLPTENYIESFNPSTGELNCLVPDSGKKEADIAVEAAHTAFKKWSITPVADRARILNKIADEIEANAAELARAESSDQGKPLWLSSGLEIPRAAYNFRFFASALLTHKNEAVEVPQQNAFLFTNQVPAGLPRGVCNVLFGLGSKVGNDLVTHPDVKLISFTGGTVTGRHIMRSIIDQPFKNLSLELGGKNPGIVFADADLDKHINDIGRSCFQNSGQICLCSSRYYVHASILDKFLEKLVKYAQELQVGDPFDKNTKMGPVCSKPHFEKVLSYIEMATKTGAKILCGETVDQKATDLNPNGFFILPTVITNVQDTSPLMIEEIFGPVVCVTSFNDEDEVIERANNTRYGLAATVWTRDLARAHRVSRQLQAGTTWINCFMVRDLNMPFGGFKESGNGREGYPYSFDFFMEKKTIAVSYN